MMEEERLYSEIHGAFKVLLWFIAATAIANLLFPLFIYEKIAVVWSHSPLFVLLAFFFGILFPTIIAVMAFQSLRHRRSDTPYLFAAYIIYMILGTIALYQMEGDPKIAAHRKCLVYYTDPYPTMVDIVLLKDWRTSKYCLVYGKYEQGTGSHTTEILDGIRFQ